MKQNTLWIILILTAFLLFGCTGQAEPVTTNATGAVPAATQTQPETVPETTPEEVPIPSTEAEETQPETVPEETTSEKEMLECDHIEGIVTPESMAENTPCQIFLRKYPSGTESYYYTLRVEIDNGSEVLTKDLEKETYSICHSTLALGDIDGDQVQEILIHDDTGGCGGFGLWRTWILKVENNEIQVLFYNFSEYDTGFESRFLEDYQMEVTNHHTGYKLVFDVKESHRKYLKEYINEMGKLPDQTLWMDPFYVFEAEDVDDDGISEVVCKQYTSILSHGDYTGTACSILKFDPVTRSFQVIDAWYEPNIEN